MTRLGFSLWFCLALSSLLFFSCGVIADKEKPIIPDFTEHDQVETLLKSMDLREKIGQMMMVGFLQPFTSNLPPGLGEMIEDFKPGGVVIMARNARTPAAMQKLTEMLQDAAHNSGSVPFLLMADQEGGIVMQVTEKAALFPGQMAVGAIGDTELACQSAQITGIEALAMGLNLVCAPVLDVNTEPDNEVIGIRSLGEDPAMVGSLGTAELQGFEKSGIIACAKHFPGHGSTKIDSHLDLPERRVTLAELEQTDLMAFRSAIAAGVPMIMTAHINYPLISPDGLPATLSPEILTGLLRRKMGFNGIIITDCLEMDAVQQRYGVVQAAVAAVKAGADIILISRTLELQKGAMAAIYDAVEKGEIREARIDESVRRILQLKISRLKAAAGKDITPELIGCQAHRQVEQRMAREAVTLVRNEKRILPLKPDRIKLMALIYPQSMPVMRDEDQDGHPVNILVEAISARCSTLVEVKFHLSPTPDEIISAVTAGKKADLIVVVTSSKTSAQEQAQGNLVKQLLRTKKTLVAAAVRNPYDLRAYPEVKAYLVTYGYQPCSIRAMVEVLFGEIKPSGKLPVSIPGLYRRGYGLNGY